MLVKGYDKNFLIDLEERRNEEKELFVFVIFNFNGFYNPGSG